MDIKPWSEVEISQPEAVLFIYLMFREDYGYHIAQEFSKAIENKKWDERRGLSNLKHENKVAGLLLGMARKNLLIELPRPGVGRPKKESIEEAMVNNPRRKYYRVNSNVLAMTHGIALTEKEINAMRKYIRASDLYSFDPDDLPIEAQIEYYEPAQIALHRVDEASRWVNTFNVFLSMRLLKLCAPDELSCIQFINTLKGYDYLTILMTAKTLFQEMQDFMSPGLYAASFYNGQFIIPLDQSDEEIKKQISKWFNGIWGYIMENKDRYINNIIRKALRYKKNIDIHRHDSNFPNFLRFHDIDKKLNRKEFGVHYHKAVIPRYLEDIINHLDAIINQIPYIIRGFETPWDYMPKKQIEEQQQKLIEEFKRKKREK